jgi:hypothetical protein
MQILAALRKEEKILIKQAERLQHQIDQIRSAAQALSGKVARKSRTLSKAGRLAISRAAKARWAKLRAAKKAVKKAVKKAA